MSKYSSLPAIALLCVNWLPAQQRNAYATDAFLIMRMVQKEHVQPKPMDEAFSVHFFDSFMESLDKDRMLFTAADMTRLLPYRTQMCNQVSMMRTDLLQKAISLFEQRLQRMDSLLKKLLQTPFQFSSAVYLRAAEDSVYPINAEAQEKKLMMQVKKEMLDYIIEQGELSKQMPPARLQKLTDSLEPIARKKIIHTYQRYIKQVTQGAAGINASVGNLYCEALAATFDPHTTYLPRTEKENFESEVGAHPMLFGFTLESGKEGVLIKELKPGSAAFKSGQLNAGDRFMSLQWENKEPIDVSEAGIQEVSALLSQSNYGKLAITVKKADGILRRVELQKESMDTDGDDDNRVKSFLLKESTHTIGYISLPAFYTDWDNLEHNIKGCANDIAKEILRLRKEGMNGLILDLRYNGGGSMQEAIELSGIFIDAGPVGQVKPREGKVYAVKDVNRGTIYDGPLVLLVNGASASASEMVAGTLQDYHRAVIIGTPTFGKATAQEIMPLDTLAKSGVTSTASDQRFIKITTDKLYRVTGATAQGGGVMPDITLPDLSEVYIKREKDDPSALVVQPIDPNRFYTPYAGETLTGMVQRGRLLADTATWSRNLQKNLALLKSKLTEKISWPLQLQAALAERAAMDAVYENLLWQKNQALYMVQNTAVEDQKLKLSPGLAETNQHWKTRLQQDKWVSTAFQVLSIDK